MEGTYLHGKRDGTWRFYRPTATGGELFLSLTYDNGDISGPFTYIWGHVVFQGEVKGGTGPIEVISANGYMPSGIKGKFWGTWKFSSDKGVFLGQSALINGNGHLALLSNSGDGVVIAEGDVVSGMADGLWTYSDSYGRLISQVQFKAGVVMPDSEIRYPQPQLSISSAGAPTAPAAPPVNPAHTLPPAFHPKSCNIPKHDAFCGLIAQPATVGCQVTCSNPQKPDPVCQPEVCTNGNAFTYPMCYCK